jgi:hypothetical protein
MGASLGILVKVNKSLSLMPFTKSSIVFSVAN